MRFEATEEVCLVLVSYQKQQGAPVTSIDPPFIEIESAEEGERVVMQIAALQADDPEGFIPEYCDAESDIGRALEANLLPKKDRTS